MSRTQLPEDITPHAAFRLVATLPADRWSAARGAHQAPLSASAQPVQL